MDEAAGSGPPAETQRRGVAGRARHFRERVRSLPGGALAWRVVVTILGLGIIVVGILLLPLPGPGWLIIFAGLGVLATEYQWASQLLGRARRFASRWTLWTARQGIRVRIAIGLLGLGFLAAAVIGSWYLYRLI